MKQACRVLQVDRGFEKFIDDLIELDLVKIIPTVWLNQYYSTVDPPFKLWLASQIVHHPEYLHQLGAKLRQTELWDFIAKSRFAYLFA